MPGRCLHFLHTDTPSPSACSRLPLAFHFNPYDIDAHICSAPYRHRCTLENGPKAPPWSFPSSNGNHPPCRCHSHTAFGPRRGLECDGFRQSTFYEHIEFRIIRDAADSNRTTISPWLILYILRTYLGAKAHGWYNFNCWTWKNTDQSVVKNSSSVLKIFRHFASSHTY